MATETVSMDQIVSLCRRRGFVFPSSEIYGGLGSTYDYGHYGVLLKNNTQARWFEAMILERDDIAALDPAVILHPRAWEAALASSGSAPTSSRTHSAAVSRASTRAARPSAT